MLQLQPHIDLGCRESVNGWSVLLLLQALMSCSTETKGAECSHHAEVHGRAWSIMTDRRAQDSYETHA